MAPLLGRVLEAEARKRGANVELAFAEATRVYGSWLPEGTFDLAVAESGAWPEPCWRCGYGGESVGRGNVTRVKDLDAAVTAAEAGEPSALQTRLRQEAVLLPLWRPRSVLAGRDVEGLEANSWSTGPFWRAENWAPRS